MATFFSFFLSIWRRQLAVGAKLALGFSFAATLAEIAGGALSPGITPPHTRRRRADGGSNTTMRRFHDPRHYRIVLFDQRGCGRSTPNASLEENTTWHLVADMERLREHLGIARWQVFGGSWGSTLALAYAEKHPERVSALVLRGIFLLRRRELEWFYQEGCSWLFPDAYEAYTRPIPQAERGDIIGAYYKRLRDPDPEGAARGRARLERLGGHHAVADRGQRAHQAVRHRELRARVRPHRMPLLRQPWLLRRATISSSRTRTACAPSRASSCMAATTWSRR